MNTGLPNKIDKQKYIYDKRYSEGYRGTLSGYEFARWSALDHFIRKILKLNNISTVLDYGSGSGLHVDLWKKLFPQAELYFCDISLVALEKLIKKYPALGRNCAEVKEDKALFDNDLFSVVLSVEVMEHVENLNSYLNDIYRLLKPGGIFIWTTPCANSFSIEHIYNILTNQIEETSEGYRRWRWEDQTHLRRLTSSEIKTKLQHIGFGSISFRFRAHLFSYFCTRFLKGSLQQLGEKMMLMDYSIFRKLPNCASMIGSAICPKHKSINE
jgi:SAM-dependent methyltransferase